MLIPNSRWISNVSGGEKIGKISNAAAFPGIPMHILKIQIDQERNRALGPTENPLENVSGTLSKHAVRAIG